MMAYAENVAGMAFSNAGLGMVHAMAHALGGHYNLPHGVCNAVLLPYVLAFAAGAMMYVVTEELIPQTQQGRHTNIGTIGVAFGFVLMMVLDVALG